MPALKNLFKSATKHKPATVKGIFVQSHVEALRKERGEAAVEELQRRLGAPISFGSLQDVPIRDEVALIEHALDIMSGDALEGSARAEAAGSLHFLNFAGTALGRTLMGSLPRTKRSFRTLLHNSPSIARIVFLHSDFRCTDEEDGQLLRITISNCDYPLEHFKGFFEEWMRFWGFEGSSAEARITGECVYEYRLHF